MNVGENTDQIPVRGPCILIDDLTVYIIRSDFSISLTDSPDSWAFVTRILIMGILIKPFPF